MNNDKGKKGGGAMAQPLDPTTNAEGFLGDATGLSGITSNKNSSQQTSQDYPARTMSDAKYKESMDIASEEDVDMPSDKNHGGSIPYTVNIQNASGDDSPGSDEINTESAPFNHPSNQGQQSISGSETDPTSDDDTLDAAQAVGTQMDEDEEHPRELDIASDIDRAEESIRNH